MAKDLVCEDQDIRILALTTVVQLTPGSIDDVEALPVLKAGLEQATELGDADTVFLARKGLNHVQDLIRRTNEPAAPAPEPPPPPAAATGPMDRAAAVALFEAAGEEPIRLANALAALAACGPTQADLDRVLPHLGSEDARVRANAVEVVEAVEDLGSIVKVLTPLLEDENHRVRANAHKALGRLGLPRVLEALSKMAGSGNLAEREAAIYAMSFLKGPEVLELLHRALRDPYEGIRLRAVKALGRHKHPASLPALRQAANDMDIDVCEEAARVIRYISMESAQPDREGFDGAGAPAAAVTPGSLSPVGRRQAEVLLELGQRVFLQLRQGQLEAPGLRKDYYEVVKAQEFLAKHRQRAEAGEVADYDETEARARLEQAIRQGLVALGQAALARDELGLPEAAEARARLANIEQEEGEAG